MFTNVYMVGEKGAVGEERWCNDPPALPAPAPEAPVAQSTAGMNRGRRPPPQTGIVREAAAAISPPTMTHSEDATGPRVPVSGRHTHHRNLPQLR